MEINCPFFVRCHFTKLGLKQEAKKTGGRGHMSSTNRSRKEGKELKG